MIALMTFMYWILMGSIYTTSWVELASQQSAIKIRISMMSLEDNKSKTRYYSTKYKTIKPNANSTAFKRVQKLYTQLPLEPASNGLHSKLSIQRSNNNSNSNKLNASISSNPMVMDYQSSIPYSHYHITSKNKQKTNPNYNKNHPPLATKEQLYEENLHLKNMVNELKQTLSKQKIQTELQKKKNKKYTSVLNRQFKKELYYQPKLGYLADNAEQQMKKQQQKIVKMYSAEDSEQNISPERQKEATPYSQMLSVPNRYSNNYKHYKILLKANPNEGTTAHSLTYMITGIKQKYEQLKTQHQKVIKELQKFKSMDIFKKLQQISIYCSAMEEDNKKLSASLSSAKLKLASYQELKTPKNEDLYLLASIPELKEQVESLKIKNSKLKQENKRVKKQERERTKLIEYLESLIIQKQNFQNKSIKTMKKINSILEQMERQLKQEKQQNQHLKQSFAEEKEQLVARYEEDSANQKEAFQQALFEKNNEIKKLQKEMTYLTTIIENWKLGEDGKAKSGDGTDRKRKQSTISGRQINSLKLPENPENITNPLSKISERRQLQKQYESKVHEIASLSNRQLPPDDNPTKIAQQKKQKNLKSKIERKRKTSSVKRSQNAKKMRKVTVEQIIDLPEYLRYRLIGSNISLEQACKLLNYRSLKEKNDEIDSNNGDEECQKQADERQKWKQAYINQAQLTSILIQQPFKLKTEEAWLLARYIVEDELLYENGDKTNGYVYCDFENQIERSFAKSIFKAFIQTHSTNFLHQGDKSQFHACEQEWQKILQKHGPRISTPLLSIASSGFISKDKWNELLTSVSAQIGANVREWCIGRMLVQSENLAKLKTRSVVPDTM